MSVYDIFEICLEAGKVRVEHTAGMGEVKSHKLRLPLDAPEFKEALRLLRSEAEGRTEPERRQNLSEMLARIDSLGGFSGVMRIVGEPLFNAIFPKGSEMRSRYASALDSAEKMGHGLRIVLVIGDKLESEALSYLTMPWEYMCDPEHGFYLGCSGRTMLVRKIMLPQAVQPFTTELPLRVLVVISEPHDQHPFGREEAWCGVEQGLKDASTQGSILYKRLAQPTFESLQRELQAWKPHVLHFIGHGNLYEGKGGALAFEDDYGAMHLVYANDLQQALGGEGLRLVFLTSCRSAETDPTDDFSGATQALIKGGIPAVLAMQFAVPIVSANIVVRAFYSALAQTQTIDEAVTAARKGVFASAESATARDWGIPVLYLQSESKVIARRNKRSPVPQPARVPVPNNLERASHLRCANLLGRGEDMIRLAQALREPGAKRRFVTLTGLGGIGKSSLAIESAYWHLERECFPKGVFWVSARDASLEILLNSVAAALGIRDFDTLDNDAKVAVLKHVHDENDLLFVIDNVDSLRDDKSLRDFLKGLSPTPRGRILLTCRRPIGLDGEKDVDVGVIDHRSAISLFFYTWGVDDPTPEQIKQVAAICGHGMLEGYPLAIDIAASLAKKERSSDLRSLRQRLMESMVQTLRDQRTKEEQVSVEASLRLSWDSLGETARNLLAHLSVFKLPFGEEAVAAMAAELGDWQSVMRELLQYRLVLRVDGRYYLHPVVQSFAQRGLEHPGEVHLRAGEFLIGTKYLEEHLEGIDHLEIAGAWCGVKEGVAEIVNLLHLRGLWGLAGVKLEQGLRAARELGDKNSEGRMLGDLGSNRLRMGRYREAIEYYEQAFSIARENGDRQGEGGNLGNLGIAYASLGDNRKAIEHFEQALAIHRENGDKRGEGGNLGNLGLAYADLGEVRKAMEYHEQALAISREIGDRQGEGNHLGNLGLAYTDLGEVRKAIEYHEQALAIHREIGDRQGEGNQLGNLGLAYARIGEVRKAIEYHEQALAISREIGGRGGEGKSLGNLGTAYARIGDNRKAIEHFEQALAIHREIGDRQGEGNQLGNLGLAYTILGEVRKAIEYYEQALAIHREVGDRQGEGTSLGNLGLAYTILGEVRKAIEYYEQALAIHREISYRLGEGSALGNLGNSYIEAGDDETGLTYLLQAEQILQSIG